MRQQQAVACVRRAADGSYLSIYMATKGVGHIEIICLTFRHACARVQRNKNSSTQLAAVAAAAAAAAAAAE